MKEQPVLRIFCMSHPVLHTEWLSLQGDKYRGAMPFDVVMSTNFDDAHVVVWDGIITPKNAFYLKPLMEKIKQSKVLLLQGETRTLYTGHPFVKLVNLDQFKYVELPGLTVIPEDLLKALEQCYQKLPQNV
jgi:hypothetical protein